MDVDRVKNRRIFVAATFTRGCWVQRLPRAWQGAEQEGQAVLAVQTVHAAAAVRKPARKPARQRRFRKDALSESAACRRAAASCVTRKKGNAALCLSVNDCESSGAGRGLAVESGGNEGTDGPVGCFRASGSGACLSGLIQDIKGCCCDGGACACIVYATACSARRLRQRRPSSTDT